jgi:membrane protease YdiL (CAAX protease family)
MNGIPLASAAGVLLALGGTTLLAFLKHEQAGPIRLGRHLAYTWGGCVALLALVLFWEQRPLSSIGIVWGNYPAWLAGALVGGAVLAMSALPLYFAKSKIPQDSLAGVSRLLALSPWRRMAVVLTAGITEEIMFRGYPIERLHEMSGSLWLAALLPLAVFTLAHLSMWGWGHLVGVLFGGALLTALYLWQHDLIACMIAHTIIDMLVLMLPALLRRIDKQPNQETGQWQSR